MEPDWAARAFTAIDRAGCSATLLLDEDYVVRWATSSFERSLRHDPVGRSALEILHPDDHSFAASLLELHSSCTCSPTEGTFTPSARLRISDADGLWVDCMLRVVNRLHDPDIAALVVTIDRELDQSGLFRAIDGVCRAAPVDETLLDVLAYIGQDSTQVGHGLSAVVRFDHADGPIVVTRSTDPDSALLFGPDIVALASSTDEITATLVEHLPAPLAEVARARGVGCVWTVRITDDDHDLGVLVCWSPWAHTFELWRHMHIAIGSDLARLALLDHNRVADLRRGAATDPLTGALNRIGLAEAHLEMTKREPASIGAVYLDLDSFKAVNDRYGHPVGDQVLVEVASRLREAVRTGDIVARVGGDEFVLLCSGADRSAIRSVADRVDRAFAREIPTVAGWVRVRASLGTTSLPGDTPLDQLIREADTDQYQAKRRSRTTGEG